MNRSEFEYLRGKKDGLIEAYENLDCYVDGSMNEMINPLINAINLPDIVTVTDDRTVFAQEVITQLESRIEHGNGAERLKGLREAVDLITAILRGENGKEEL